jgi:hypothetical protein
MSAPPFRVNPALSLAECRARLEAVERAVATDRLVLDEVTQALHQDQEMERAFRERIAELSALLRNSARSDL